LVGLEHHAVSVVKARGCEPLERGGRVRHHVCPVNEPAPRRRTGQVVELGIPAEDIVVEEGDTLQGIAARLLGGEYEDAASRVPPRQGDKKNLLVALRAEPGLDLGAVAPAQVQFLAVARFVEKLLVVAVVAGNDAVAREAFDVVYSLTHAERARYREMGLEFPRG